MKFVDVSIDTRSDMVDEPFTYACEIADVCVGDKVSVPFSGSRARGGYIVSVSDETPAELAGKSLKKIASIDVTHSLPENAVSVALWMRRRYFCRLIDALACFAPPADPPKRAKNAGADSVLIEDDSPFTEINVPSGDILKRELPSLTSEQESAFATLKSAVAGGAYAAYLVHGVTGSGKTELYMRVAAESIAAGRGVIVLVPEISLTPQTAERFVNRFGEDLVSVMHSKLSKGDRYAEWIRAKEGRAKIVVGARSAVFAPLTNIGAIIVDEEHETTYKSDMTPKYDTVEVALKRAARAGAVCVLGSATPSVISMYRAKSGMYGLIRLTERYNKTPLPRLTVVDMREELKSGNRSIFGRALSESIEKLLAAGSQAILFLNRRGYSTFVSCRACGYTVKCPECGITMTYHKERNRLECHFCGVISASPKICPECGSDSIKYFGIGTEQVEERTGTAFPEAKIARLDLDTTRRKGAAEKILTGFGKGETNILIGTQMVAKGLDYSNVMTVGVIAADVGLNVPDFRAAERTFQLITQAAGRAGRGDDIGDVFVQTYSPQHYAIEAAAAHDYEGFYRTELLVRQMLSYPPYSDIIQVTVASAGESDSRRGAEQVLEYIVQGAGAEDRINILGPQRAVIFKQGDEYRHTLNIKATLEKRGVYERVIYYIKRKINTDKGARYRIIIDVNPFSLT